MTETPQKLLQSGAAAIPLVASGGGESRGNLLGPALGLLGSFSSLPEESSNKAAQRQDTGSFQPSLADAPGARLRRDLPRSDPVWPGPLLQTGAGTNPAEEVVKASGLQRFPQPCPACRWEGSPRGTVLALSYCPLEMPAQLLAALECGDLQGGYSGPLQLHFSKPASSHCVFPRKPGAQQSTTSE